MMSPYAIAILTAVLIAIGQLLFKKAALHINTLSDPNFWDSFVLNWWFVLAIIFFATSTILWVLALSHTKLMSIYPLTSLAYVFVPIGAFLLFNEKISVLNMLGLLFILIGIFLATKVGYAG